MIAQARTRALINDLRASPAETACVEFKKNQADPSLIGKLISALSNAARLARQHNAYLVWGIRDGDHAAVGTTFEPATRKESGQPLEIWLANYLKPSVNFSFAAVDYEGVRLIVLTIDAASVAPVEFDRIAYLPCASVAPPRACLITRIVCVRCGPNYSPTLGKPGRLRNS